MNASGWIQLVLFVGSLFLITGPLGRYLVRVLDPRGRTWLDPVLQPVERLTCRLLGRDATGEHDWKQYASAMLVFSLVSCGFTYGILRLQHLLPLNPQGLGPLPPDLAFNTAVSFMTNTDWQGYGGEGTMSYFSQMVALTFHNFTSAAVGIGIAAALVRGISRSSTRSLGNFWVDLVRITLYLLLPLAFVFALVLVSQGVVQNFRPYTRAKLVEPIPVGIGAKENPGTPVPDAPANSAPEVKAVEE